MKKKKFSIMLSIATLCLCVAVLAFGVYAAKKASLTTTGSINFEAHNCKIRVLGSVTGAVDSEGNAKEVTKLTDETETTKGKLITGDVTWAVGDLYFDDLNCSNDEIATPIVFTFVMTNESDYPVTTDLNLTGDLKTKIKSNVTFESNDSETINSSGNVCVLNNDQTITATLTLTPATEDNFAIDINNLQIKFEKPKLESTYSYYTFEKVESTKQATIKAKGYVSQSEMIIPSSFVDDSGNIYIVSDWDGSNVMIYGVNKFIFPNSFTSLTFRSVPGSSWGVGEVVLPSSITELGSNCFYTVGIDKIVLPANLTTIGGGAFMQCTNLTEITIPNSVKTIGNKAFSGCTGLTEIVIPKSVTSIGSGVFTGCSNLTKLSVDSANSVYDSRNNCNAIIQTSNNSLIAGINNSTIPSSVASFGDSAFSGCSGLSEITIPTGVTTIGDSAFANCGTITTLTIPTGVTTLGSDIFNNTGILSATIGSTGPGILSNKTGLTTLSLSDGLTSIEDSAFSGCTGLTEVVIPKSVTSIGLGVFSGCSNLETLSIDSANTIYDSRNSCNAIIKTANNELITGLKISTIPTSVTSIGEKAFENSGFELNDSSLPSGILSIGDFAFQGCSGSVVIPASVTSIGKGVFTCSTISVDAGNSTYDSRDDYNGIIRTADNTIICGKSLDIPATVTAIGDYAFYKTGSVANSGSRYVISEGITSIGDYAFVGQDFTWGITLPASLKSIGSNAFDGRYYYNMYHQSFNYNGTTEQWALVSLASDWFKCSDGPSSITCSDGSVSIK